MMSRYAILVALALAFSGQLFADDNLLLGHEVGANGDHLTGWFASLGQQVLTQLRQQEKKAGQPLFAQITLKQFEDALTTQLVLVTPTNRAMLRNQFGEVKDVRVVTEARSQKKVILIDEKQLAEMYDNVKPDLRLVLHAYLMAAGVNDDDFRVSAKIALEPIAAPPVEKPRLRLDLYETIRGHEYDPSQTTAAQEDWKAACEKWKTDLRGTAGVIYASCGAASTVSELTYILTGSTSPRQEYGVFGSHIVSKGRVMLSLPTDGWDSIEEKISHPPESCQSGFDADCVAAKQRTLDQYAAACADFKANVRKQMGDRLIYVSCGEVKEDSESDILAGYFRLHAQNDHRTYFQDSSTAKAYFWK